MLRCYGVTVSKHHDSSFSETCFSSAIVCKDTRILYQMVIYF